MMAAKKLEEIRKTSNSSKALPNKSKLIRSIKKIIDLNSKGKL